MEPAPNPSSAFPIPPIIKQTTPPTDWTLVGNTSLVFSQILAWTNGQPELTERLCQLAASQQRLLRSGREIAFVNQLVQTYFVPSLLNSANPKDQKVAAHLTQVQNLLLSDQTRDQDLLKTYRQYLASPGGRAPDNRLAEQQLLKYHILEREPRGEKIQVANLIYKKLFSFEWTNQYLQGFKLDRYHLLLGSSILSILLFALLQNFGRWLPFTPMSACQREASLSEAMSANNILDEPQMRAAIDRLKLLRDKNQLSTSCQDILSDLQYSEAIYLQAGQQNRPLSAARILCEIPLAYYEDRRIKPWFTRWSNLYKTTDFPQKLQQLTQGNCPAAAFLSR